jgi:hypothetical protein
MLILASKTTKQSLSFSLLKLGQKLFLSVKSIGYLTSNANTCFKRSLLLSSNRNYANWLIEWVLQFSNTEVPEAYAIWTGIWAVGAALQNNVYMQRGHSQLFPHLYIFLVGPGSGGKSYSAEEAMNFLKELSIINTHCGDITKSYLISHLEGIASRQLMYNPNLPITDIHPPLALYSDELAHTISSGEHAAEFLRGMTQLYNSSIDSGTHAHSMRHSGKPVISWLALATVRWLRLSIPSDMVDSGFVARVITILENLSPAIVPQLPSPDLDKRKCLIDDLNEIAQINGPFSLSPEALEYHTNWYTETRKKRLLIRDEVTMSIYGREDEHAMKVAMIISAAKSDNRIIEITTLRNATELVYRARQSNIGLYRSLATGQDFLSAKYFVLEKISNSEGAIGHTVLFRQCTRVTRTSKIFNEVIKTLVEEGAIEGFILNNTQFYKLTERRM